MEADNEWNVYCDRDLCIDQEYSLDGKGGCHKCPAGKENDMSWTRKDYPKGMPPSEQPFGKIEPITDVDKRDELIKLIRDDGFYRDPKNLADYILASERRIKEAYEKKISELTSELAETHDLSNCKTRKIIELNNKISELKHAHAVQDASDSQTIEGLTAERDHYRMSVNNLQKKIDGIRNALNSKTNRYQRCANALKIING